MTLQSEDLFSDLPDLPAKTTQPIFISYSRSDSKFAQNLYRKLDQAGFNLWRDRSEMIGGDDWWRQIRDAIDNCETMVLCLSPLALDSHIVAQEWHYARQVGKRVIPLLADEVHFRTIPRWMSRVDWVDIRPNAAEREIVWGRFIKHINTPYELRKVPFMVDELPPDFVARPSEFEPLVQALVDDTHGSVAITAALKGAGGYGKTTLARAICHDIRVRNAFDDGIIWITLGEEPGDLINHMADIVTIVTQKHPTATTLDAAKTAFREALKDRYLLIVIDDIWKRIDIEPFLNASRNAAYLLTTRNDDTLPDETYKVPVDAMLTTEAMQLISYNLPDGHEMELRSLAKRLGEWPLLLKLTNGALRDEIEFGASLSDALTIVSDTLATEGWTALDNPQDYEDRNRAVEASIRMSLERLSAEELARYIELAIFPEDSAIPLQTVARYWKATGNLNAFRTRQLCIRLKKLSLLLSLNLNTSILKLHDVIRGYLQTVYQDRLTDLHIRFLDSYEMAKWHDLPPDEHYLWEHIAYHLVHARYGDVLNALLVDYRWLQAKLNNTNIIALMSDFNQMSLDESHQALAEALQLSAHNLHDKTQLSSQLYGRTMSLRSIYAAINDLLTTIEECAQRPTFISLNASLNQGGSILKRIMLGHNAGINSLSFSPDGNVLASGSGDGLLNRDSSIRLWDTTTGQQIALLRPLGVVNEVLFSPDGRILASASSSSVQLWDVDTLRELARLKEHKETIWSLAFSSDGNLVASGSGGSRENAIFVWDVAARQLVMKLEKADDEKKNLFKWVTALAFSPDGKFLVSGADDATVTLWDVRSGEELGQLEAHEAAVKGVAFSADSKSVISISYRHTIIWNIDNLDQYHILEGIKGGGHMAFDQQKAIVAIGKSPSPLVEDCNSSIRIWNLSAQAELNTFMHSPYLRSIALNRQGTILATGSGDNAIRLWGVNSRKNQSRVLAHDQRVTSLSFSPDGNLLASASYDHTIRLWNVRAVTGIAVLQVHSRWCNSVAFSPNGLKIASTSYDGCIYLWDLTSGIAHLVVREPAIVYSVCFSPDGSLLAYSIGDAQRHKESVDIAYIFDLALNRKRHRLEGHRKWVYAVTFSPDGKTLATGSDDSTVRLWSVESGEELTALRVRGGTINTIAYSPNEHLLALALGEIFPSHRGSAVTVWDTESESELWKNENEDGAVRDVKFSPDGTILGSVSADRTLKLWEASTGNLLTSFTTDDELSALSWSSDGETIAVAGNDGIIYLLQLLR